MRGRVLALVAALVGMLGTGSAAQALTPGDLLTLDYSNNTVLNVDAGTGARTLLSTNALGAVDAQLNAPDGLAVEPDGHILVTNESDALLLRVDPSTGLRTRLSGGGVGTGPAFVCPDDVEITADDTIYVIDYCAGDGFDGAVFRVDPLSGNRTIVSDDATGTGPNFDSPATMSIEADGNLIVADTFTSVLRVDPTTGNRTTLSSGTVGAGPFDELGFLFGVDVGPDGAIYVTDRDFKASGATTIRGALLKIDPVSGDRTVLASQEVGTGPVIERPTSVVVGRDGFLYVAEESQSSGADVRVFRIDPASLARTVVSDVSSPGPAFATSYGLEEVPPPPTITSSASLDAQRDSAVSFTVTTGAGATGQVATALSAAGLPDGLTFTDNGDGTATISGTPTAGGQTTATISAANVAVASTQSLVVTVTAPPQITSADATTFTENTAGSFDVTSTPGYPTAAATYDISAGTPPTGVTLSTAGVLGGTPTQSGVFTFTVRATNSAGLTDTQPFTLTVNAPPQITSAAATSFTRGSAGSFTATADPGFPTTAPTFTVAGGTLPTGLTLAPSGQLSGTPTASGVSLVTLRATNAAGLTGEKDLSITVNAPPAITSADNATIQAGQPLSFTVQATAGFPTATTLSQAGALPDGVTFVDNGDRTATLSGTPTVPGSYALTLKAANSALNVTQVFTLVVTAAPLPPSAPVIVVPSATPPATAPSAPSRSSCTVVRRVTLHLFTPKGVKLHRVKVKVGGRTVRVLRGNKTSFTLLFRSNTPRRVKVDLQAVTTSGKTLVGARRYRLCGYVGGGPIAMKTLAPHPR